MQNSMSGWRSWRAPPFSALFTVVHDNPMPAQSFTYSGKRYFRPSTRFRDVLQPTPQPGPWFDKRTRILDPMADDDESFPTRQILVGKNVNENFSRDDKPSLNDILNQHQLLRDQIYEPVPDIPQDSSCLIYNAIRREAFHRQIPLDRKIYNWEFYRRLTSLYPISFIHPQWSWNIKVLLSHREKGTPRDDIWKMLSAEKVVTVTAWLRELQDASCTVPFPCPAWENLPADEAARRWPNIALWLLLYSPSQALNFLRATNRFPIPPFRMVSGCFRYLEMFHSRDFENSPSLKTRYRKCLLSCLHPRNWSILALSPVGLRLYLTYSKPAETVAALEFISEKNAFITLTSLLFIIDLFLDQNDIKHALDTLRLIRSRVGTPEVLSSKQLLERCSRLLLLGSRLTGDELSIDILQQILEAGVKPNQDMLNVVISHALRDGDEELAWTIFHFMWDQGIPPDSYTYMGLLHDAVRHGDTEKIHFILRYITQEEELVTQPHILSKTLHAIHVISLKSNTSQLPASDAFREMFDLYSRAHDTEPLVTLGIIAQTQCNPQYNQVSPPSRHALGLMIATFLKTETDSARIWDVYSRFQELVLTGHKTIAPLAETDHIFNSFLMAFRPDNNMLNHCVKIVEYMLQPLPDTAVLDNRHIQQAKPSIRTWTILLHVLLTHYQPMAALRVREMMLERGVRFSDVTWNVMIRGFARMQMVKDTAAALKTMEKENWSPDGYTLHAISLLDDQDLLRTILHRLDGELDAADYEDL